jgi:hypothetical protein
MMSPEEYESLDSGNRKRIIEGHLSLIATYGWRGILNHIALSHSDIAGYGPPGSEEKLHRTIHVRNPDLLPAVHVNGEYVVVYSPYN